MCMIHYIIKRSRGKWIVFLSIVCSLIESRFNAVMGTRLYRMYYCMPVHRRSKLCEIFSSPILDTPYVIQLRTTSYCYRRLRHKSLAWSLGGYVVDVKVKQCVCFRRLYYSYWHKHLVPIHQQEEKHVNRQLAGGWDRTNLIYNL